MKILEVKNLSIYFNTNKDNQILAASNINFSISKGETLSIVGESGSGKTIIGLSIMKLLPYPLAGHGSESKILLKGEDILQKSKSQMRKLRGKKISMIFQEPMTSLNPFLKCGEQIKESIFSSSTSLDRKSELWSFLKKLNLKIQKKSLTPILTKFLEAKDKES